MELHCKVAFDHFQAGNIGVFYILGSRALLDHADLLVFAHVHGHLQASEKWMRDCKQQLEQISSPQPSNSVDLISSLPADPTPSRLCVAQSMSKCVFASARIPVSPTTLTGSGLFIECELPFNLLPSFKGRSVHINYYLSLQLQSAQWTRTFHFPFLVMGSGSSQLPFPTICAGIVEYAASATRHMEPSASLAASALDDVVLPSAARQQFSVRDRHHICNISLRSTSLLQGDDVEIDFDFERCFQSCFAVRASLVQLESKRDDQSVFQERVVSSITKHSLHAQQLLLRIRVPSDAGASFICPLIKVDYRLLFEFYAVTEANDCPEEPMSFSIPVRVLSSVAHRKQPHAQLSRSDLCIMSMESSLLRVPIVVDQE